MKRTIVAPEHKKFFQINGYISFESLLTTQEMESVWSSMLKRRTESNHENISRSIPAVLTLARKLGATAATLLDRKPIRFAYDCFVSDLNELRTIEDREIGLLLSQSGRGFFFTDSSQLYNEKEACYLFLVFTANYVNNPIVFK